MKRSVCVLTSLLCLCLLSMPFSAIAKTEEEYQQELRTFQKRNIQLENKLEQLATDLKNATTQVKLLQGQITKMTKSGEDNAKEVREARAALKDVKKQLKELLAQQSESNDGRQEKLEAQLNKVLQEKQELEKQLQQQQKETQDLEKDLESLKKKKSADSKSAELKKEVETLQTALDKQKKQYKANLILLNEREEELQDARNKIRSLNKQKFPADDLQQTEARAAELESTLTTLNVRLLKLSQENEQLKSQLSSKTPDLQQNEARLQELERKLAGAKVTIFELDRQRAELESRLSSEQAQQQAGGARAQELENKLAEANAKVLELHGQRAELETRLSSEQTQQQEGGAHAQELEKRLAEANTRVLELDRQRVELETRLSSEQAQRQRDAALAQELENTLAKANAKVLELDRQRAELETRLSGEQAQQQEGGAHAQELEKRLAEANAKVLELDRQRAELESRLSSGQAQQLDTSRQKDAEILRLEDELLKAADYINSTSAQVSDLNQKNSELSAQLRESQQAAADLHSQIAQSSNTVRNQSQETSRLQDQVTLLQSQLQDSEQDKKLLQDKIDDLGQRLLVQGSVPEEAKKRIQELTLEVQDIRVKLQQQQQIEREYPMLQQQVQYLQTQVTELEKSRENAIVFEGRAEELQIAFDEARRESSLLMEQNLALQEELADKAETYQSQGRKFQEYSQRNQELEQQYQQGLQELALKEKLLQQALLEKSILEKVVDDEGVQQNQQYLQQQVAELQRKLAAFQATELRDGEYSRLLTDLQEKLQKTETQNKLLQKELLDFQQNSLQAPAAPAEDSGQLRALDQKITQLETELAESRQYVQRLQQQLATVDMPLSSSPAAESRSLSRFFPADLGSGGMVQVLGSSPDNSKTAYLESSEQQQRLFIYNNLSRQAAQITELPRSGTSSTRFAWAFDSEHFLFATGSPGNYALNLGNSSMLLGQPIHLAEQHIAFAWSPTQGQFAYFSGSSLIIQNLQQQTLPIQIDHQPGLQENSLAWAPDGRQIAISARQGANFDIFLLGFANNTPTLQSLVASSSDDLLPSWSPDGRYLAFYVRAEQYDTKVAVSPSDKSRAPYIVGHNASLPPEQGPRWISGAELVYVGEEHLSAAQNSVYIVNISTGQRSSMPLSMLLAQ